MKKIKLVCFLTLLLSACLPPFPKYDCTDVDQDRFDKILDKCIEGVGFWTSTYDCERLAMRQTCKRTS